MSDLISRKAAIDALAKFVPYAICDESTESYTNGLTDAYNLILQLPSAQPEQDIEHCATCAHDEDSAEICVLRNCKYAIAKLIDCYKPKQPEQRWIPVSERMPEPRIDVWCNSDMGQMVGYYDEYAETWYGRDYLELIVTAWMPLPEPYREERTEE